MSNPTVRAKFRVISHKLTSSEPKSAVAIELQAVGADDLPENQRFHKYTPSGSLTMWVDNPPVVEAMPIGATFYLDFTPVAK